MSVYINDEINWIYMQIIISFDLALKQGIQYLR